MQGTVKVSVLNKFRFGAALTATLCVFLGTVHPARASETIGNITPDVLACLQRNNVNEQGYVTYESNGVMLVGLGRPGNPGGVRIHYKYAQSQEIITLDPIGPVDFFNVVGQTKNGISKAAAKCRSGQLH